MPKIYVLSSENDESDAELRELLQSVGLLDLAVEVEVTEKEIDNFKEIVKELGNA